MEITAEMRVKAFIPYLPCACVVDATRYHSKTGVNCDLSKAEAIFDSINKFPRSDSRCNQVLGVTYNYGEEGMQVMDVFNKSYKVWADFIHPENCQLILTPLSHITDEDAIEVCNIANSSIGTDDISKASQGKILINKYWYEVSNVRAADWIEIINYLRSKSYDCDNLIEQGLAIGVMNPATEG